MIPLVLVHGFMGGSAQWGPQMDGLKGYMPLIPVDLPGFGALADMPPVNSIGGFADWVHGTLRAQGITRYHLMGHSMGGMIVQEMIRRDPDPVARLILYGTGPVGVLPGRFETIEQSKSRARTDGPEATARRIAATWFLKRDADPAYPACADIAARTGLPAMLAGLDAMEAWSGLDHLPQITAKTRIIWGEGDRTYPWEQARLMGQTIPDADLSIVPGCAHAVHLEKPNLFNDAVRDFLL